MYFFFYIKIGLLFGINRYCYAGKKIERNVVLLKVVVDMLVKVVGVVVKVVVNFYIKVVIVCIEFQIID